MPDRSLSLGPRHAVYVLIALLLVLTVVIVPATGVFHVPKVAPASGVTLSGKVTRIADDRLTQSPRGDVRSQTVIVQVGGKELTIERTFATTDAGNIDVKPGDHVLLSANATPD